MALRIVLLCCAAIAVVYATSSGEDATCNALMTAGCDSWDLDATSGLPDRTKCNDGRAGFMPWVDSPVRHASFTVRSGDSADPSADPTSYVPGELNTIYVRVTEFDLKYRGLLMHGNAADGTIQGYWGLPFQEEKIFWSPPPCADQAVMHISADVKPYLSVFRWLAPPAGAGTITFSTLFKVGPANEGQFYYPLTDLVLTEGAVPTAERKWFQANLGESCQAACTRIKPGSSVDNAAFTAVATEAGFKTEISRYYPCSLPILSSCSSFEPAMDGRHRCSIHSGAACPTYITNEVQDAASFEKDNYRFCPCVGGGTAVLPTGTGLLPPTTVDTTNRPPPTVTDVTSTGATGVVPTTGTTGTATGTGAGTGTGTGTGTGLGQGAVAEGDTAEEGGALSAGAMIGIYVAAGVCACILCIGGVGMFLKSQGSSGASSFGKSFEGNALSTF